MSEGQFTPHQPSWDDEQDFMKTDAERDAEAMYERRRALECAEVLDEELPERPAGKSLKRPREVDPFDGRPNLADYFDEFFGVGQLNDERIKICGAYASYLRTLLPKKPKINKKK